MGNGALAIGPKLPRPSSTLPERLCRSVGEHFRCLEVNRRCCSEADPSQFDPNVWSGRALQEVFVGLAALRSCINVSGL